jgi:hypothetical protein
MLQRDYLVMNSQDMHLTAANPGPAKEELEAACKVLASLQLARKNYSLYPEGHTICTNSLEQFQRLLEAYLCEHGNLRFDVEKDQLIFMGVPIHSVSQEEGELPFTLFRDGILWIMFTDGIEAWETKDFLRIINKYSTLSDEPEGDVVTDLWETQFPHIKYEIVDFFWGSEQESDFTPFDDIQKADPVKLRESDLEEMKSLADPEIDPASLVLTQEEKAAIREMVLLEEEQEPIAYLDALIDSLLEHREQENFEIIIEVLAEEFQDSLTRADLDLTLRILQSLQYILKKFVHEIPWAKPLIEDFFIRVSSTECLGPLQAIWPGIDSTQADTIKKIFIHLQPEAIHTLGAILLKNPSLQLQKLLLAKIVELASQDIDPLESLLKSPKEELVQRLVSVLVYLKGHRSLNALIKLIHHPSERVRQIALKGLLQRDPTRFKDMFTFIDDKDEAVRHMILKNMGHSRNHVAEKLLRDYLEHHKFKNDDSEHVIYCFRTLGQCGSQYSIPFLSRTLLSRGLMPGFHSPVHRQGAAIALSLMEIKEAQQILKKAGRSLYPSVRRIARRVLQEQALSKEA